MIKGLYEVVKEYRFYAEGMNEPIRARILKTVEEPEEGFIFECSHVSGNTTISFSGVSYLEVENNLLLYLQSFVPGTNTKNTDY